MDGDGSAKIGPMLEQLGSRFDLVIEAVSGYGGRLDALREEILTQFTEVGRQIRFLCDQLAENRGSLGAVKNELTAELIRLGEALGATRIEFRQGVAGIETEVATTRRELAQTAAQQPPAADGSASAERSTQRLRSVQPSLGREVTASMQELGGQLRTELKQTNKTLTALSKKLDRFDDRVSVEVRDHGQRLRKLEGRRS